jgi:hypothetical protein
MPTGIYETLDKINKIKKKDDRVQELKNVDSFPIRVVLQSALDPNVVWDLPEGRPPFKPSNLVDQENVLHRDARLIAYFIKGLHNLPRVKRETMFIEFLERLAPKDAELILNCKEKKLPFKNIDVNLVKEALVGLIPDEQK